MKRFAILTLVILAPNLVLGEPSAPHSTPGQGAPLQAGVGVNPGGAPGAAADQTGKRPPTLKTGSEDQYAKIRGFTKQDSDIEVSSLVDGKFKMKASDLDGKFSKWISAIENTHGKIWTDCKEKPGIKELNSLLKNYVTAIAEEVEEATSNSDAGGFLKDSVASDKAAIKVDRLFGLTAGVRAMMDKQLASAPADKQERLKKQNESLVSMMDKTNSFLAGLDAELPADQKAAREKALAPFQEVHLTDVAINGLKAGADAQSIEQVVQGSQPIQGCWWDTAPAAGPQGGLVTETTIEEGATVTTTNDDAPVAAGPAAPTQPAYEYKSQTGGSYSSSYPSGGYNSGYNGGGYSDALGYGALGGNYLPQNYDRHDYQNSDIPYTPMVYPNIKGGSYAPPAAPAAPPASPAYPISGGGGGNFGAPFLPPVSVQTGSAMPYFPPMMPSLPPPPPTVVGAQTTETETVTESFTPSAQLNPVPMPAQQIMPPPTPPTIVNDINAYIRVNPDGTISTVPGTNGTTVPQNGTILPASTLPTAPAGSTPITSSNPNAGQATSNVNSIIGR